MTKNRKKKRRKAPEAPADGLTPAAAPGETTPEPIPFEDMEINDLEVQIHQAVVRREKKPGRHPDTDDLHAMEEVLARLTGACVLFENFTTNAGCNGEIEAMGRQFLSGAMMREADRLFRLYHGHGPKYD
ncbi:MAG: hypothetical protein MI755_21680 [Sphingomonadales bacterium]|nr:hypothetical protein [Sphingomonadales bacterium]